jgi:hypothetical protein
MTGSVAFGQGSFTGPLLGFTFDSPGQALRRISGIPGSALVGDKLDLGFNVASALISPGQDFAIAAGVDGSVNFVKLGASDATAQAIPALPVSPDRFVLSPNARAAAFVYGTTIQTLSGLPDALDRVQTFDVSALPNGSAAVAISDDGQVLLVSSPDKDSSPGGVFVITQTNSTPLFVPGGAQSALAFLPDAHDALIIDEAANTVTELQDAGGATNPIWAFSDDRLGAPRFARSSSDGQRILVASAANNTIAVIDRNGQNSVFSPCSCSPNEIEPLNGLVYQITDSSVGLIWSVDITSDPRIFFLPLPAVPTDAP